MMLVLSRHRDESVLTDLSKLIPLIRSNPDELALILSKPIEVMVVDIRGDKVRLGFEAHSMIPVHRDEVFNRIKAKAGQ
jgi:carbon storage regulator